VSRLLRMDRQFHSHLFAMPVNARAIHLGCQTDHNTEYYNKNGVKLLPYSFCTGLG